MNITERLLALWNSHDHQNVAELYAREYDGLDMTYRARVYGADGAAEHLRRLWRAFPDLHFQVPQPLMQDDRLILGWTARGTHRGTVMSIPPTGRVVLVNGISLLHLGNDKVVQAIHLWDMAGMLRDLGLLPELDYQPAPARITWQDAMTLFSAGVLPVHADGANKTVTPLV